MRAVRMTEVDRSRIMELCQLICEEHDARKFQELVTELNDLLAAKEQKLQKVNEPIP
jgi:hypothetical protein